MKKAFIYVVIVGIFLISCSKIIVQNSAQNNTLAKDTKTQDKTVMSPKIDETIRAVTIKNIDTLNLKMLQETDFNMVVLQSEGVRSAGKSYSTSFKTLKMLNENVSKLEKSKINYFVELTTGPGFSQDSSISSLFSSSTERMYFGQMLGELVKRYNGNEHFAGISIDLKCPNINEDMYYDTLTDIITRVRKQYPDLTFIVNLHPLAFENKLENIPRLELENVIINLPIEIRDLYYPGTSSGIVSEIELNKNTLLKTLQVLKQSEFKSIMVTLDLSWNEKTDVFLQDLFEINKMLGFNSNISYGNSKDSKDFSNNEPILKLIKRHNQ